MVTRSVPETTALAHFVELADAEGRLLLLPVATVDVMLAAGITSLDLRVSLIGEPTEAPLTITEAARLHLDDVDGMTMATAKAKISRACRERKMISTGSGSSRRINPTSLRVWRLAERERNLSQSE